jgi:chlorobactene glucosyltransferase
VIGFVAILVAANVLYALHGFVASRRPYDRVSARREFPRLPSLSIIVPARNEERQIEGCVRSLLAQRHPDFEVIAVDDCSEDATAEILERVASKDSRLRVMRGEPLPPGWVGKPWAIVQGVRQARGAWLLFTDADTFHTPEGAASVQSEALERELDALSVLTNQDLESPAELALLPALFLAILSGTGPIADVGDPGKPGVALFNGQYILVSRRAYDAIGGHAAVRGEIAEDLELARRFKQDGRFRIALMASEGIARTRMYRSLSEIWRGFTKNFALGVRGRAVPATAGTIVLACVSPLSPALLTWLLLTSQWVAAGVLAASMLLVLGVVAGETRLMRLPVWTSLLFPVGTAFTVAVLIASIYLFESGRGVQWRGRRYRSLDPG